MPVDSLAHESVVKLFSFLQSDIPGVMFGHQDALSYGIDWRQKDFPGRCDVYDVCGDYPAVFGWDLGHIEIGSSVNIDKVPFNEMRENIKKAHAMGGINTISWHPHNPVTDGSTWDNTIEVVKHILPGGNYHEKFKSWLTIVAEYLLSLKDENNNLIPILFRPYHEHTGSWFWWGDNLTSIQEYIDLWKFTVTYLRDTMNVHNLLYVYSSDSVKNAEHYLEKYPGDEWIDVLGLDFYDFPHNGVDYLKDLPRNLHILQEVGTLKQKPIALTETGNLCMQNKTWWTDMLLEAIKGVNLKWILIWINLEPKQYYCVFPGQSSALNFKEFYKNSQVLFLNNIKNI